MDRIRNLVMTAHLYALLVNLRDLAVDGQEAREADADGGEDRLRNAEAKATLDLADFYVEEFRERARDGVLPEDTTGILVFDPGEYKDRRMDFAEKVYEAGLDEMRRCGIEPGVYTVASRIDPLVAVAEQFARDNLADDARRSLLKTLWDIRVEAGLVAPGEKQPAE